MAPLTAEDLEQLEGTFAQVRNVVEGITAPEDDSSSAAYGQASSGLERTASDKEAMEEFYAAALALDPFHTASLMQCFCMRCTPLAFPKVRARMASPGRQSPPATRAVCRCAFE